MDTETNEDSRIKILTERYSRLLGLKWKPCTDLQKKKIPIPWLGLLFILLLIFSISLYVIYIKLATAPDVNVTRSETTNQEINAVDLKPSPAREAMRAQKQSDIPLETLLPAFSQREMQLEPTALTQELPWFSVLAHQQPYRLPFLDTLILELNNPDESALINPVSNDKVTDKWQKTFSAQEIPINPENKVDSLYFVIVMSTASKDEAITFARKLHEKGFSSEVILGSTNYYGVVLGRFSLEDAKQAINTAHVFRVVSIKPYLITKDRIKEYVYPKFNTP
jgi:hypothetical protein